MLHFHLFSTPSFYYVFLIVSLRAKVRLFLYNLQATGPNSSQGSYFSVCKVEATYVGPPQRPHRIESHETDRSFYYFFFSLHSLVVQIQFQISTILPSSLSKERLDWEIRAPKLHALLREAIDNNFDIALRTTKQDVNTLKRQLSLPNIR